MVGRKHEDIIILSIQPKFAKQIFSGEKKYEFRKPHLPKEISYVILVENGTREILGGFRVGEVYEKEIEELWRDFAKPISDFDRFNRYYEGWDTGIAIEVQQPDEFEEPIPIEEITSKDDNLQVPDQYSFIYSTNRSLQILTKYSDIIREIYPVTSLSQWVDGITHGQEELNFREIVKEEEEHFRSLFKDSSVPDDYEDIDDTFLDHILESHERQSDPYGYFTDKKSIYAFTKGSENIGYTVTTWKIGNSVKYGPTILEEDYRGKGLGPKFRRLVDNELQSRGVRKVYSTIPDNHHSAYKYLLKSGYQVEAHMRQQYSKDHSELVFGKLLNEGSSPEIIAIDRNQAGELDFSVGTGSIRTLPTFVVDAMAPWYENIGEDFVESVIDAESRDLEGDLSKKGKRVYVAQKGEEPKCAAIASKKRGSGVKISPFLTSVLGKEVNEFLKFVEKDLREELSEVRKFYTHVPVLDGELVNLFRSSGYQSEGVLREPYKDGIDMVFLGKIINYE